MGKQGYKGSKCWNDTLLSNNDISDENYFATTIYLTNGTYKTIDKIKNITQSNRCKIISTAVDFYLKYILSEDYVKSMKSQIDTLKS